MGDRTGQATVELVAAVPALVLGGLVALQLLVTGYVLTLADGAAESGAAALAGGGHPRAAVRAALPKWEQDRVRVAVDGTRVEVRVRPPSPLPVLGQALEVSSSAWARSGGGG